MELVPHFFWKHVINGSEIKEINSDSEAKGILRTEHTPTPPTPSTDIDFHAFENLLSFIFFFFFCFLRFFGQGCPPPAPFKKNDATCLYIIVFYEAYGLQWMPT